MRKGGQVIIIWAEAARSWGVGDLVSVKESAQQMLNGHERQLIGLGGVRHLDFGNQTSP